MPLLDGGTGTNSDGKAVARCNEADDKGSCRVRSYMCKTGMQASGSFVCNQGRWQNEDAECVEPTIDCSGYWREKLPGSCSSSCQRTMVYVIQRAKRGQGKECVDP